MNTAKPLFSPDSCDLLVARVTLLLAESDLYTQRARRIHRMNTKPANWRLLYQTWAKEALRLRTNAEKVALQLGVDFDEAMELHRERRASKPQRKIA